MDTGVGLREIAQLVFSNPGLSANGRMNVDSKRAAYHDRNFELGELLELWRNLSPTG
jgi:hypothetical protein